jgi:cytochrome P450
MEIRVTRHAEVTAVLSDPGYVVPSVESGARPATLAWLRETVSRFSEGSAHDRRRGLVVEELARLDPQALQLEAFAGATAVLDVDTLDEALTAVVRAVPTAVLGRAMGVTDLVALTAAVPVAAAVYLTGSDHAEPDEAVATLVELLRPTPTPQSVSNDSERSESLEVTAARIAVLMQSCEATATLITKATHLALERPESAGKSTESIIAETLRFDPPVPAMRRVHGEDTVVLDIPAANRDPEVFADPDRFDPGREDSPHLTYGAGRRPCPGAAQATALAAGVVEAIRQWATQKRETR